MKNELLVGRQPIFTRDQQVIGYELLYRDSNRNAAEFNDGVAATRSVLARTFMEIGVHRLVGDKLAFVNLPQELVRGDLELPTDPSQFVLEVLEDVTLEGPVIEGIRALREQGYRLAIDDVVSVDAVKSHVALFDIIKVDVLNADRRGLPDMMEWLRQFPVTTLAEKVETEADFDWCLAQGFDWFQGYFFSKPVLVSEPKIESSAVIILQLLAMINSEDASMQQFERLAVQDATLTFKILRLINSASYGLMSEVTSLKQALSLLGLRKLRSILTFMLNDHTQNRPVELSKLAVLRGEMTERVLQAANVQMAGGFTVGLFSALEALLGIPLSLVLQQVPLAAEIKEALLYRRGALGEALTCILAFEHADWNAAHFQDLTNEQIQGCFVQAAEAADLSATLLNAA